MEGLLVKHQEGLRHFVVRNPDLDWTAHSQGLMEILLTGKTGRQSIFVPL